jgi:hypothetical protein
MIQDSVITPVYTPLIDEEIQPTAKVSKSYVEGDAWRRMIE